MSRAELDPLFLELNTAEYNLNELHTSKQTEMEVRNKWLLFCVTEMFIILIMIFIMIEIPVIKAN